MKYFSMFSGIGGFEVGMINAIALNTNSTIYCECIGFSEINKYAIQIYKKHFGGHKNYGDATKIKPEELPEFELLIGGFPCQAFSIAGNRRGFEDTRGTLFFEIARVLKVKQPRMFLLENVKGLLNHDGGNTFTKILQTIDELGYDAEWEVLNSKHFGVPQNRERVFIIGYLRGTSRRQIFPLERSIGKACKVVGRCDLKGHDYLRRVYSKDFCSPTLPTKTGGNHIPKFYKDSRIRRLTPTECERLQGFPDGWTEELSDTQRYKCLGNAVTTNVIQAIMEKIIS